VTGDAVTGDAVTDDAVTDDSVAVVLDDIRHLIADAHRIVASGRARFFDDSDRTLRLAAKAIVIDLQDASDRLPDRFRHQHHDAPWDELRAMGDCLARHDSSTDYGLVWNALSTDFPRLGRQLGV
jgi:uncharacterized protein with HEPN domain